MAPKGKKIKETPPPDINAYIAGAGLVAEQPICDTLEKNYMPYAMSVIVSRAIPEIDGFKPSHRKLLYTMYGMGLLNGGLIKSANIVGRTMQLNPHGDAAIYDTMVRLSEGNEALLHPYVESKGSFGKAYSRDMQCAAARYTEAKLSKISAELFNDIDKDTVDFVDNYDATMKEPTLLPVSFPSVLVNANTGIAVGMASSICPFNLREVCETTIAFIKDESVNIADTLIAPDFPGGGQLLYNREDIEKIYETGRGSIKIKGIYSYDKSENCIDITQIPPTTTSEAIIEKVIDLVKQKKITEINDIRDETDRNGLKITMDLKRGVDPDKFMQKVYKMTPMMDSFGCNFNILIAGSPKVMGIGEILTEWVAFRTECIRRRVYFDLSKCRQRFHMLKGLSKILLDIDKAIKIVRETVEEKEVVPNLMIGFGIDKEQAEYVAEIKLRHLNREYILKRLDDLEKLEKEIEELEDVLGSKRKILNIIIKELKAVAEKYGKDRKTVVISAEGEIADADVVEEVEDYPVHLFVTKEGYFKKITPQSLRMSGEQKLKETDEITQTFDTTNRKELLFFTDKCQVYKAHLSEFSETKASAMGDFVAGKLGFDDGESLLYCAVTVDYKGYMLFIYENGRIAKVDMKSYYTKTNRKKLIKAYSEKQKILSAIYIPEDTDILISSSAGKMLLINTGMLQPKISKDTVGVSAMTLKRGQRVVSARIYPEGFLMKPHRYRPKSLPAVGSVLKAEETGEQLKLQ